MQEDLQYKEVEKRTGKGYELSVDSEGTKRWYLNGQLHREGGPAVEFADGTKFWYLNDINVSEEEFNEVLEGPMDRLPLYINTVFAPIVRRRLSSGA